MNDAQNRMNQIAHDGLYWQERCERLTKVFERERDAAQARIAALEEALHRAQYEIGELGRNWSASTVSYDCQKIQRNIKAVYDRFGPTLETEVKP